MANKRQRKKEFKKLGVWGFNAIVTGNRTKPSSPTSGVKHNHPIGTPVKFVNRDRTCVDCMNKTGFSQWVSFHHLKLIK